jgi:hypothetical protein
MQAFNGPSGGSTDGSSITSISNTEYWQASLSSGTLTSATLGFTRTTPVGSFTGMGRSTTANGTYGNVGGTASGTQVTGVATGNTLGFYVMGTTAPLYYWSNAASMNWSSASSWQTTTSSSYSSPITASIAPNASNSLGITIRSGHTVSTNGSSITLDQLIIATGGTLNYDGGTIAVENGIGEDIIIESGAKFTHTANLSAPTVATGAVWRVKSGASIEVNTNNPGSQADYYASNENAQYSSTMIWENNAVFIWNSTSSLSSSGLTYFPNADASTIPIFRLANNISLPIGANSATTFNGLFEANGNACWQNSGNKTFRNGIIGTGSLTQNSGCGQFIINGNTAVLGGSGTIILNTSGMQIAAGNTTLISNKAINATSGAGTFNVSGGATLDAATFALTGSANYSQASNGTLISASASGVNGSIQLAGTKTFNPGANYTFNGSTDQITGILMGTTIGTLTINNPSTVTLSQSGHTTTTLNLQAGSFRCGTNHNLNIANGGSINSTGGNQPNAAEAGTITFQGTGQTTGTNSGEPKLYDVTINGSIDFNGISNGQSATIWNRLQINAGSFVTDAPFYHTSSTLVYNIISGSYNRSVEWGQPTVGAQGYPYNVLVQGGTTLNLANNPLTSLEIGGNLTIGTSSSSSNIVDMNSAAIPLRILGNLVIGDPATSLNRLTMSTSNGGNLELYGNFTRYKNNNYYDNEAYNGGRGRSTIFKGSGSSVVDIIDVNNPANEVQKFHKMVMDKTDAGDVTLLVPNLFIESELELINGIMHTTQGTPPAAPAAPPGSGFGLLTLEPAAFVTGTTTSTCFVNGQIAKQFGTNTATEFIFPVGKSGALTPNRPFWFSKTNSGTGTMTGEYFYYAPPHIASGVTDNYASSLLGIVNTEYWQFERNPGGDISGKVIIDYKNPGSGNWRGPNGTYGVNPCFNCNVAVVKRNNNSGNGVWDFTSPTGVFASSPANLPEYRWFQNEGRISSAVVSTFSPFTIGFSYNVVLGNSQPARLLEFSGTVHNGDGLLSWTIDRTGETVEFVLQHSLDGIHFETISNKLSGGLKYNHVHTQLAPGRHIYRLLVRERNGSSYYSRLVELVVDNAPTRITGLQSTVVNQYLTALLWSSSNQVVKATIYDRAGKLISQQQSQLLPGNNNFRIPVALLATGLYYVEIATADGVRKTLRWLKE